MSLAQSLSNQVFTRDGWKCRHCNNRNGIHPHHLVYKSQGGRDELHNLLTLCAECHQAHHMGLLGIVFYGTVNDDVLVTFERKKEWQPCTS